MMFKFLLVPAVLFLKFVFLATTGITWSLFDPLLALVVVNAFIRSLETRDYCFYAIFCGFCQDVFSADIFGIHIISYLVCALVVACALKFIYRDNWVFIFPFVFIAAFLNQQIILFLKVLASGSAGLSFSWFLLLRCSVEASGTTLLAYPLYKVLSPCAKESTE